MGRKKIIYIDTSSSVRFIRRTSIELAISFAGHWAVLSSLCFCQGGLEQMIVVVLSNLILYDLFRAGHLKLSTKNLIFKQWPLLSGVSTQNRNLSLNL